MPKLNLAFIAKSLGLKRCEKRVRGKPQYRVGDREDVRTNRAKRRIFNAFLGHAPDARFFASEGR
jgi:hypothetical protein